MTRLRICSFNVQNLYLPGNEFGPDIQGAAPKRRAELRALARGLQLAAADVVALQEVGSLTALGAVNALLSDPYQYLYLLPGNSNRGIHLAYACRTPAIVTSHQHIPLRDEQGGILQDYATAAEATAGQTAPLYLQRDLLQLELQFAGSRLTLFNLHLKSPNQPRWCRLSAQDLRAAECRLVATLIREFELQQPGCAVVLLGDFNEQWQAATLQPFRDIGLSRAADQSAALQPATFWSLGISIDHILLNAAAASLLVSNSWKVIDDKRSRRGSDHCPVVVDLQLRGTPDISNQKPD